MTIRWFQRTFGNITIKLPKLVAHMRYLFNLMCATR